LEASVIASLVPTAFSHASASALAPLATPTPDLATSDSASGVSEGEEQIATPVVAEPRRAAVPAGEERAGDLSRFWRASNRTATESETTVQSRGEQRATHEGSLTPTRIVAPHSSGVATDEAHTLATLPVVETSAATPAGNGSAFETRASQPGEVQSENARSRNDRHPISPSSESAGPARAGWTPDQRASVPANIRVTEFPFNSGAPVAAGAWAQALRGDLAPTEPTLQGGLTGMPFAAPELPQPGLARSASHTTALSSELERSATIAPATSRLTAPMSVATARRARSAETAREIFAGSAAHAASLPSDQENGSTKTFVNAAEEALTSYAGMAGTTGAKSFAVMPASSLLEPSAHPAFEYAVAPAFETPISTANEGDPAISALPRAVDAHEAVENILRRVDAAASLERTSVNLDFSVGDTALNVRVELHAEVIRTTFRTESPELRAALAQEWEAVAVASERGVRLAPAVFTSSEQSPSTGSSDSDARQQERAFTPRDDQSHSHASGSPRRESPVHAPAHALAEPLHATAPHAPAGTARRLNFFA
jgi:hypothetical protein